MTTIATDAMRWYANEWDAMFPTTVLSGIVPDLAHLKTGGYHCSIEDLNRYGRAGDYSNRRPGDIPPRAKNMQAAAAVDMSASTADMKVIWDRVFACWSNPADPRRRYWNAFNGWNGVGSAERLDFIANTRTIATPDHKWHSHDETPREFVDSVTAMRAKASVLRGQSIEQWNTSIGAGGAGEDDDVTPDENRRIFNTEEAWIGPTIGMQDEVAFVPWSKTPQDKDRTKVPNKLVLTLKAIAAGVVSLNDRVAGLEARPTAAAAKVELTDADREDIADRVARKLGALRFDADADGS